MNNKTYQEWVQEIQWLRDKIILPDNTRIDKTTFMTNGQVDANKLNNILLDEYRRQTT
jgi:hypothetical protein